MIDTNNSRDINEEVPPSLIDLYLFNRDQNFQSQIIRKPSELVNEFSKLLSQAYVKIMANKEQGILASDPDLLCHMQFFEE